MQEQGPNRCLMSAALQSPYYLSLSLQLLAWEDPCTVLVKHKRPTKFPMPLPTRLSRVTDMFIDYLVVHVSQ